MSARLYIAPPDRLDAAARRFASDRPDELGSSSPAAAARGGVRPIPMTTGRVRVGGRPAGITVTGEDRARTVPSIPSSSAVPPRSLSEAELRRMRADALRREQCMMDERLARDAKVERQLLDRILGGRA